MSRVIGFRVDEELDARLERLAELTGRAKASLVREAVDAHLDDLEDVYMADLVMERVEAGEEALFSLEDVER